MDELLNVIVRHQIYLEGLKNGRNAELVKTIATLDKELRVKLAFVKYDNLGDMSRSALNKLVLELKRVARTVFDVWLNELIRWLEEYCSIDADFWRFAYTAYDPSRAEEINEAPEDDAIFAAGMAFPMAATGLLTLAFLKGYSTLATEKIGQAVVMSYANAETPKQLMERLSGTPEARNRNGLLQQFNRQGQAVTNTVIQHIAAQTNASIASLAWPLYLWCSVIDDGTTNICLSRNGKVYRYGEGPLPPAHIGCRSSVIPFDGGSAPEMPRFKMWASAQPEAFVKDAFDGKPPSSYEGSKAISLDEFRAKRSLILS